jgi:hypothetical protein
MPSFLFFRNPLRDDRNGKMILNRWHQDNFYLPWRGDSVEDSVEPQ